jgi:outer membrane lipoprotein-sorting protein
MNRRHFLAATAALAALPALAQAQQFASREQIATYLNGLGSADGSFTQFNADGSRSLGTFMLQKPGRIRFDYTRPDKATVVADGTMVAIMDPKAMGEEQVYELKRTPLSMLLRTDIDLDRQTFVRDLSGDGNQTRLTLIDPKEPDSGSMLLVFTHAPFFHLTSWTITDEGGAETRVEIETMQRVPEHPPLTFDIVTVRNALKKG